MSEERIKNLSGYELYRTDIERTEAEKDYADMRRFQAAFIEADQERIALRAEVKRLTALVQQHQTYNPRQSQKEGPK